MKDNRRGQLAQRLYLALMVPLSANQYPKHVTDEIHIIDGLRARKEVNEEQYA